MHDLRTASGLRVRAAVIAIITMLTASACTSTSLLVAPDELMPPLTGVDADAIATAVAPIPIEDIMALDTDMRFFARSAVGQSRQPELKMNRLSRAILHPGSLGLRYHDRMTRTATEAFSTANGNCLTLSILFVALAREVGLEANFYEVNVLPEWTLAGDVVFSTRHINVGGRLSPTTDYVMDFLPYEVSRKIDRRKLTDKQALGQFYNNLGAEFLAKNDVVSAYLHFKKGVELAPNIDFLWSNLAVVYSRHGQIRAAENAALQALRLEPNNTSTMSNLAGMYRQQGRIEEADVLAARIAKSQRNNPYYQFVLGEREMAAQNYEQGLARLKTAIDLRPQEPLFYLRAADAADVLNRPELADQLVAKADALKRKPGRVNPQSLRDCRLRLCGRGDD